MRFADRRDAGRRLAALLAHLRGQPVVVLGLPRGGVPVAFKVARALDAPLDVIMVRKLGVPFQPELGMGAIGEDGVRILNQDVIERGGISARIGGQFVHRAQPQQAAASPAHLAAVLATGRSLVVWPEGALDPAPGLRPFHLAAFEAAATTGAPVLPAGIRGSRELLRPGSQFPHRAALHVAIGDLIPPRASAGMRRWPCATRPAPPSWPSPASPTQVGRGTPMPPSASRRHPPRHVNPRPVPLNASP